MVSDLCSVILAASLQVIGRVVARDFVTDP